MDSLRGLKENVTMGRLIPAGVLAFSVSARTREFEVRLAIGSSPRHLLAVDVMEALRSE